MSSVATYAREYATALDRLEAARSYLKIERIEDQIQKDRVLVSWLAGSSCTGYKEMQAVISGMVTENMRQYMREAIRSLERDVILAGQRLKSAEQMAGEGLLKAGETA